MTDPTGLDYQEAYRAMYPGLAETVRLQDVQDTVLKTVDRAARLRRTERERVKNGIEPLIQRVLGGDLEFLSPTDQAHLIRKMIEEIR